ncbi:hypothetical protein PHISP_05217 [Aspergillus sp. HF37]|nr:hypothetical protein PHISP_05217 [Aspergillus sp. HF37]
MSELRQRHGARADTDTDTDLDSDSSSSTANQSSHHAADQNTGISILDIIRVLVTLAVASCGLSYYMMASESVLWGYRPWFTRWPVVARYLKGPLHLTPAQLALYNGTDPSLPIYLAVNGSVFDVSANPMMYGPGGSYHFFAGRDATRAFVSGCFQEDLIPDLAGVEEVFVPVDDEEELRALSPGQRKIRREKDVRLARANVRKVVGHWENFFRSHKRYFQVGAVARDADGDGKRNGKRELCEAARLARPKREKT